METRTWRAGTDRPHQSDADNKRDAGEFESHRISHRKAGDEQPKCRRESDFARDLNTRE